MYGYGYRYNSGLVVGAGGGAPFLNTYSTQFDGVDAYVNCGNPTDLQITGAFTLSVWTKLDSSVVGQTCIISKDNGTSERAFTLWSKIVDKPVFYIWNGATSYNVGGTTNIADDMWHHVAVVYVPSTSIRIYVDGVLEGTNMTSIPASINNANYDFKIGHFAGSLFDFKGLMDEVSVFNSAVDIADLWDGSGQPTDLSLLATPPIAWYRMGDNGTYKSPQWLLPNNENKDKVSNYSTQFDGVDDYIELGSLSNLQNATEYSICSWFKTPLNNQYQAIYSWFDGADGYLQLLLINDGSFIVYNYRTSTAYGLSATGLVSANTWYNALVVFDGSGATNADRLKLYLNGTIPTQTGTMLGNGLHAGAYVTTSGAMTWALEGNIDEVSIFNSAISIGDVWDGSGEPIDVSAVSGLTQNYRMGEEATFSGGVWTVPDQVGSNDGTSNAMTIEDRVGNASNSEDNALSINMDLVDRTTDVPT